MPESHPNVRILAVDDEVALLELLSVFLNRLGYEVETFSSAREALARFSSDPGAFSVVMADLNMPDMPGEELLEALFQRDPSVRVLVCSGSCMGSFVKVPGIEQRVRFLQKPFMPKMLDDAIRGLLDDPGER
ncbi:MAG: response regulator [Bryobacteraceae bacterium]